MHYYQFNIGDYIKDTTHLEPMEDLAYRRMIDLYYSTEKALPADVDQIARLTRMRSHSDCIAIVLQDFFTLEDDGYHQFRIDVEIAGYQEKSDKARNSAKARWKKAREQAKVEETQSEGNANALNPQCEGNAKHKPLTNNQDPINKDLSSGNDESKKIDNCPHDSISKMYMEILPELPRVAKLTDKRKRTLSATWRSDKKCQNSEFWAGYFNAIRNSDFLMGRSGDWSADFDFVINQNKMIKIIEGAYE